MGRSVLILDGRTFLARVSLRQGKWPSAAVRLWRLRLGPLGVRETQTSLHSAKALLLRKALLFHSAKALLHLLDLLLLLLDLLLLLLILSFEIF